jgi:Transposase DDE domain
MFVTTQPPYRLRGQPLSHRRAEFRSQQQQKFIGRALHELEAVDFFNVLTGPELLEQTEAHLPEHRERLYPPTVTLAMFMRQALSEDGSCQRAVNGWAAQRVCEGLKPNGVDTGAYCRARQRLPVEMVKALTRESGRVLSAKALRDWRWHGRAVKLVDGSTVSMPDTPQNQAGYPQPITQASGVGFPLARVLAVICLSTGAVLEAATCPFAGAGNSELGLLRALGAVFNAGDVMLADTFYCNYFILATLQAAGVDAVFEQHSQRITDFRRGRSLGARDHCVQWPRPRRPPWMTREHYASFPESLSVRELKTSGRILLTTLLDHRRVRKQEVLDLYCQRWQVELDLRNIKITLGVDVLSCRTPQMVVKELWVHLLAYNLIRLLMAQAAAASGVQPRQLSFKHTVQLWTEWTARKLTHSAHLWQLLARVRVADRPGRVEPRMKKRRPKSYPWMKKPRPQERQQIIVHGTAAA